MNADSQVKMVGLIAAGLLAAACGKGQDAVASASATVTGSAEKAPAVFCAGINECSGKSACKTQKNDCAGKNKCKGQGVVQVTAEGCKAQGGTVQPKAM